MEKISPSSKTSSFYPQNVEEITAQRKMSRKSPQFREKMWWRWGNILVLGVKPGENAAAEEKCPETATKPGKGCKISPFKWYICKR